jgi:Tfp pilus assembly protein PilX
MRRDDRGSALVLVLLCATLFLALGGALVTVASTEATISATFRESAAALAGAEAALARATADLATTADWNGALTGSATSSVQDGTAGARRLPDGTLLDLVTATNIERCGSASCTEAELDAVTADRPWGVNNPRWQRYASGSLRDISPSSADAPDVYVIVWVGDDPLETDGNPLTDDPNPAAPGHDAVLLRAAAHAAYSVRRRLEVRARREDGVVRLSSWREIR